MEKDGILSRFMLKYDKRMLYLLFYIPVTFIGAFGSDKSKFGEWMEKREATNSHRVDAHYIIRDRFAPQVNHQIYNSMIQWR